MGGGYTAVLMPEHPRAQKSGYVYEHILVLEKTLGRSILPGETAHHIDGNRSNNDPGNLMLFKTPAMHTRFHGRLRAFEASGHWDWRLCQYCHQYDDPINLFIRWNAAYHNACRAKYLREQRRNLNEG